MYCGLGIPLIGDLGFDQFGEQNQRFLPAQVAPFGGVVELIRVADARMRHELRTLCEHDVRGLGRRNVLALLIAEFRQINPREKMFART